MLDILVILDRSGSMQDARADHEGGLRSFVDDQKQMDGDVRFTLVQFDTQDPCEIVYDRAPIASVGAISLIPRGGTPLLDAVGKALAHLATRQEKEPSEGTVVMIITDGEENSSAEWTRPQVKARIGELEKKDYKFLFLGANVDAFAEASSLGIPMAGAAAFHNGGLATRAAYAATSSNFMSMRDAVHKGATYAASVGSMDYTAEQRLAMVDDEGERIVTVTSTVGNTSTDKE